MRTPCGLSTPAVSRGTNSSLHPLPARGYPYLPNTAWCPSYRSSAHSLELPSAVACFANIEPLLWAQRHSQQCHRHSSRLQVGAIGGFPDPFGPPPKVKWAQTIRNDVRYQEINGVTMSSYLDDPSRVFKVMFPDTKRAERVSDEVYRIFMLERDFIVAKIQPVVDMRVYATPIKLKNGEAACRLNLEAVECKVRGLDIPDDFKLTVKGMLEPMSSGASNMSVLLGKMEISIEATLTPIFQLTPLPILQSAGDVFLEQIMMPMKEQINRNLVKDYQKYARVEATIEAK